MVKKMCFIWYLIGILFAACNKPKDKLDPEVLIAGSEMKEWGLESVKVHGEDFGIRENSDLDDINRYFADGSYEGDEGDTKSASNDPQVFATGSWHLINNKKYLVSTINNETDTSKILVLNENTFEFESISGDMPFTVKLVKK